MQMKYLMYDVAGSERPIIFAADMAHADMHSMIGGAFKLLGAGFVSSQNCPPRAYGRSTTLGIASRPEDSDVIRRHLGWEE